LALITEQMFACQFSSFITRHEKDESLSIHKNLVHPAAEKKSSLHKSRAISLAETQESFKTKTLCGACVVHESPQSVPLPSNDAEFDDYVGDRKEPVELR
jgi:hypothetical protein